MIMNKNFKFLIGLFALTLSSCVLPSGGKRSSSSSQSQESSQQSSSPIPTSEIPSESTVSSSEIISSSIVSTSETPSTSLAPISTSEITVTSVEPSSEITSEITSEPDKEHCLIILSGGALPFTDAGAKINNEDGAGNVALLIETINKSAGFDLVSSIQASGVTTQTHNSNDKTKNSLHITLGTQKVVGSISFTFSVEIKKAVIKYSAYYKQYTASGVDSLNVDTGCKAIFDDGEVDVPSTTGVIPEIQTHEINYESGTSKISIKNKEMNKRVFVDSIEIFC